MTTSARHQVAQLLGEIGAPRAFTARRTAPTDDLRLTVGGVGELTFPVPRSQARELCEIARPARYGRGEETLLDPRVRDTWEVPKSRVKIDRRRWNRTLEPVLGKLRAELGLPPDRALRAEFHSLLVYARGQFFLPHQDSEKDDGMVATLVVALPSTFRGGSFVVEHLGERVTYRGSRRDLTFIAFYADCRHEVRPVTSGHRIVLTFNLLLAGGSDGTAAGPAASAVAPGTVDALAEALRDHFESPLPPRWSWQDETRDAPKRLVYLLDHQYTERGLAWERLKANDAARAEALRAAAEREDCELVLALAEIQETWGCYEPDLSWSRRHRYWERDEDDDWLLVDDPSSADVPDAYELGELYERGIALERWIDPAGGEPAAISTGVEEEEVCATTPNDDLQPYASEYEGYTGNAGNTMDRWYRRAAVVLWPRRHAFAVRAEASASWALAELERRMAGGELRAARELATAASPFWEGTVRSDEEAVPIGAALAVARGLEEPELATSLLRPFAVEALAPAEAPALAALVDAYGADWWRSLLSVWSARRPWQRFGRPDPLAWIGGLPELCEELCAADDVAGLEAARFLIEDRWRELEAAIGDSLEIEGPGLRERQLEALPRPILGVLESAAVVEADTLRDRALAVLCADDEDTLLPVLVDVLRLAAGDRLTAELAAVALGTLRRHAVARLEERLARPARAADDWSIPLPAGCDCELCDQLATFLADPDARRLEWPIAKQRRKHVHHRLDAHELPVTHRTRRSGSPYTLVLTKKSELFEREERQRRRWRADLEWLRGGE